MLIRTVFELNSIKDQLSLIAALSSHIDFDNIEDRELDEEYTRLLTKMNNTTANLKEKYEEIKKLLEG